MHLRPARYCATDSSERGDDNIYPTVRIGVLSFRIGFQIGGLGAQVWILPYAQGFIESVKAVTTDGGGADG